jgi:hypothetical protein
MPKIKKIKEEGNKGGKQLLNGMLGAFLIIYRFLSLEIKIIST